MKSFLMVIVLTVVSGCGKKQQACYKTLERMNDICFETFSQCDDESLREAKSHVVTSCYWK